MLESENRCRGVCVCGPRSWRKSSRYCGELPALHAPASSIALANVYEASVYQPFARRFSHLACNALYQDWPRCAPTVICDHCGIGTIRGDAAVNSELRLIQGIFREQAIAAIAHVRHFEGRFQRQQELQREIELLNARAESARGHAAK